MSLLLRKTINSNSTLQSFRTNNTLSLFIRQSTQYFSTETQPSPPPPEEKNDPHSIDPFLQDSATGLTYGRFYGVRKHTLKTDIVNLFEGSNLTPDDIRVLYNRSTNSPYAAAIKFPSRRAYDNAQKALTRAGRISSMDRAQPSVWDAAIRNSHDGKTVLLEGLPPNALTEDIERFLYGCEFDPSSIRTFVKYPDPIISQGRRDPTASEEKSDPTTTEGKQDLATEEKRDPIRMATVRFSTQTQAMNALITKNRGFCLNNQISVRVLH